MEGWSRVVWEVGRIGGGRTRLKSEAAAGGGGGAPGPSPALRGACGRSCAGAGRRGRRRCAGAGVLTLMNQPRPPGGSSGQVPVDRRYQERLWPLPLPAGRWRVRCLKSQACGCLCFPANTTNSSRKNAAASKQRTQSAECRVQWQQRPLAGAPLPSAPEGAWLSSHHWLRPASTADTMNSTMNWIMTSTFMLRSSCVT